MLLSIVFFPYVILMSSCLANKNCDGLTKLNIASASSLRILFEKLSVREYMPECSVINLLVYMVSLLKMNLENRCGVQSGLRTPASRMWHLRCVRSFILF